tara:strand:+ start:132 stop:2225 length:2094 start_codon:yes stop_codon:yes gene_type:complete
MAREIDLSGIAAGVQQANQGRRDFVKDAFDDARDDRFKSKFVEPFIRETVLDGPERRRKERIELQMRGPELMNSINKSKAGLINSRSEALMSTFDRIENFADGPEAGAKVIARELMAKSDIGKQFLGSGIFSLNHPKFKFIPQSLKKEMIQLYEERINKQAEFILKTHNEIKDSGILKNYDVSNAYLMSQDNYDKITAAINLDVGLSDPFRRGVNAIFGDDEAADVAMLYKQSKVLQNKIDRFYNESEKFVNSSKTIVKIDDNLETYLDAVNNLDKTKYNNFVKGSKQGINEIGTDKESELYKNVFTTDAGVLAQWLDGDVDENGNYAANPKRLEGSRTVLNPFGMEVKDFIPFNDISAIAEENITYRQRAVIDGKLVERDVPISDKDFRGFLGRMVTNLATGLKFESERNGNPNATDDLGYLAAAYRLLAQNGYIRMKDANNIEKGLILVNPLSSSNVISGSGALSVEERELLGIDNLYNMGVNRTIKDAEETGGGDDETFVKTITANAENDIEEELDETEDVDDRERLFLALDDVNDSKLSDNAKRRLIVKQLIAPTKSNQGVSYVYDSASGLTYTAGELTKADAESIYKRLLLVNEVDSDPEIRGLIDAVFTDDNLADTIQQDLALKRTPIPPFIRGLINFNDRQQQAFDLKQLEDYANGNSFISARRLKTLFEKYDLEANASPEKVQEFLRNI